MAEVTGLRNNALPYPVYGVPFGVTFPLLDADGDPVSPSSPDSEVSKNGDTFADCTNEAVEIATSSGICYLLLTATEMTADVVTVRVQSTGAKTTVLTLYPRKLPVLASGTAQGSNDTGDIILASGDSPVNDIYNGCLIVATIDTVAEARIINDYVGSSKTAEVSPAFVTATPDSDDTYVIYLPEGRSVSAANVFAVSDDMTAADNAEAFFDGTGYAGTNNVIPTVTTVTTVTNLTNAPTNGDLTATMKTSVQTSATASIVAFFGANLTAMITSFYAATVSTGLSVLQTFRLIGGSLGGKTSGAGTATITIRNYADTVDALVVGMTGSNRTSFTFDLSA